MKEEEFIIKLAKQVDKLTEKVNELSIKKQEVEQDKSRFHYSVTFSVPTIDNQIELQNNFLNDLKFLISKYPTTKLSVDFKK